MLDLLKKEIGKNVMKNQYVKRYGWVFFRIDRRQQFTHLRSQLIPRKIFFKNPQLDRSHENNVYQKQREKLSSG